MSALEDTLIGQLRILNVPESEREGRMFCVIGVDPGPTHSAYAVVWSDGTCKEAGKVDNDELHDILHFGKSHSPKMHVVIESIQSYGAPVGKSTFETCYWIGEFRRRLKDDNVSFDLIPRQEYATSICGGKANDATLRQALLLRFGGDKKGEPLNALKGSTDLRSAFAIAVYWLDKQKWEGKSAATTIQKALEEFGG